MDPTVLAALKDCKAKNIEIDAVYEKKLTAELIPSISSELEPLFDQRQKHLDAVNGLWSYALLNRNSPTHEFTAEIDQKLLRSLQSIKVTKRVVGDEHGTIIRKITFTMSPSVFMEGGEFHRETNTTEGSTVSVTGAKWKVPEHSRKASILRLFEAGTNDNEAKVIGDAIDLMWQNPVEFTHE